MWKGKARMTRELERVARRLEREVFLCRGRRQGARAIDVGWTPISKTIMPVTVGETIHKIGRTTEYTSGQVIDDSAYGRVNYGGLNYVEFDDVILTTAMLEGGDSGDSAWKSITMMD